MGGHTVKHPGHPARTTLPTTVAVAVALMSMPLRAAPATPPADDAPADLGVQEAKAHFSQGIALYEDGDFAGALFEFERAYAAAPDYRLQYNIGVTLLETNDYASAKRALEQYLRDGGDQIADDRRAEVAAQLRTLAARVGTVTIHATEAGARVTLDGEPVGTTPLAEPLIVNLGRRRIAVQRPGYRPYDDVLEVAGGATLTVEATLEAMQAAPSPAATPALDVPRPEVRPLAIGAWISLGAAGLLGAGATITGVLALRADDAVTSELGRFPADEAMVASEAERRRSLALTTDVLVGVAVAAAATALGLGTAALVHKRRRARRSDVSWSLSGVRGRF